MEAPISLLLAQHTDTVDQGIGFLQTILSGGVPLICLVIAAACSYAFYKQLTRNNVLEKDFRTKVEDLLREMLALEKSATESTSAAVQAVEGYSHALKEQQLGFDAMKLTNEAQGRDLRELRDKVVSLESTIRGSRDAQSG